MVVGKWSSLYSSLATSFPHQFEKKTTLPSKVVTVAAKDQNFFADSWSQWKNLFRHQGSFLSFQMAKIWPFHFPFHHSIPVEHSTDSILPFCWGSRFHRQISQPLYSHTIAGALGGLWFQPVFTLHTVLITINAQNDHEYVLIFFMNKVNIRTIIFGRYVSYRHESYKEKK